MFDVGKLQDSVYVYELILASVSWINKYNIISSINIWRFVSKIMNILLRDKELSGSYQSASEGTDIIGNYLTFCIIKNESAFDIASIVSKCLHNTVFKY